jgi:hypothetical protein
MSGRITRSNPERQMMTLRQFENALDRHRREALAYLETLVTAT